MKSFFKKYYLFGLILLLIGYTAKINWSDGQWQSVLETDAKGYYAYVPAVFIHDDLNFEFFESVASNPDYDTTLFYDYRAYSNGATINKYFIGEAVLLTPFFAAAHACALLTDHAADGYSQPYIIAITLAALFYLFIGLLAMKYTLRKLGFSDSVQVITLLSFTLGTHLFYYSIGEMGMSHVYSFAMIALFIASAVGFFKSGHWQHFILLCFWLGLIVLIRPINALVVLSIPFLAGDARSLKLKLRSLLNRPKLLIGGLAICGTIAFIQPFVYYLQTNSFFVDAYQNEGFNFLQPHIWSFLFSFKKGLFVYTPLCFVALGGFWYLRKSRFQLWALLLFLLTVVYVLSSWWMWYYGGSFSARPMVDYLPYFMLLFACLIRGVLANLAAKVLIGSITLCCLFLNQFQTLQYRYYIIHWSAMTAEKYWSVFLDFDGLMQKRNETSTKHLSLINED